MAGGVEKESRRRQEMPVRRQEETSWGLETHLRLEPPGMFVFSFPWLPDFFICKTLKVYNTITPHAAMPNEIVNEYINESPLLKSVFFEYIILQIII